MHPILALLPTETYTKIAHFIHLPKIDSTNRYALASSLAMPLVCVAEEQSAGRGQYGRQWQSQAKQGVYLSIKVPFPSLRYTQGLSIALAVSVARAVQNLHKQLSLFAPPLELQLKWTNDLLFQHAKLAGILVETIQQADKLYVVAGVGLNVKLSPLVKQQIEQKSTDLQSILQIKNLSPHFLTQKATACLIKEILDTLLYYPHYGLLPFLAEWRHWDYLAGHPVQVCCANEPEQQGIALGINEKGELLIDIAGKTHCFNHGEVRVRRLD